ncbi:MAG: SGNH/GDSL hydrolase family protein [Lachnospiraceae bacterium]|nr:SGNH/GDSL hydrolase family protein [Lachnospiraceae bacterium]MDE6186349.1 SGNH/GDSL hydrolase family protein [Lachnospiraceae bacterium]
MYSTNLARLKNCMRRAARGEELTIGFLGGSITQGSLASEHTKTYAYRVYTWWKQAFPLATFYYVNGGIGGTTSHYGAARAESDLLMYQPDFVVVDFSVNDEADTFFQETYEGVIRKLLAWDSMPAVLLLNNVFYDTGENAQAFHNAIGEWYGIPYVSVRDTIYRRMKAGEYARTELTADGLHPNDKGHELVAGEIICFLEKIKEEVGKGVEKAKGADLDAARKEGEQSKRLPLPMTDNAYEHARRLTIREISPELSGFRADTEEKMGHLDGFKNGWIGKKAGDRIVFEVEASCIAVQYRKTVQKPALKAKLILDEDREHGLILDGNFEQDWGDCQYLQPILHHGEKKKRKVEIEILPGEEGNTWFYLMALIIA